jgi:hypothetical protein
VSEIPVSKPKRREFCPWCGAEDYGCENPSECQREIQAEERGAMEREIEDATRRIQEEHGYGW